MMLRKSIFFIIIALVFGLYNCTDKQEFPTNPGGGNNGGNISGDTVYVQLNPIWKGFNKPEAILLGREPFVYVADTKNDQIVMLDISGQRIGVKEIQNPTAIAQDHKLNLMVTGDLDYKGTKYSAVFRINLYQSQHDISIASVDTLLPFSSFDYLRDDWQYTGLCVFKDNKFFVARKGPKNDLISPDNAILFSSTKYFEDGSKIDTINNQDKVAGFQPLGTGLNSTNQISSITSQNGNTFDIVMTIIADDAVFKVQWLQYLESQEFTGYVNKIDINSDLMQFNKFSKPMGSTIDNKGNLFVADAAKDSIFKFNSFGDELESFGGSKIFNNPHGVAHFDKTLYVLDTDNDRIVRYILSTELD